MKGIQNCSLYIYPLYYCTVLYIYLEVEYKGDEELYTVHLTPVLQLYGENKASCSSINVVGISVNIVLEKKEPGVWTNLTTLKYSWIR